jgi:hypothetical protein
MNSNFNKTEDCYIRKWSKKIKAIALLGGKCSKCGADHPALLDFHHDSMRQEKMFWINRISYRRWSMIEKEIKGCVLLCANCHGEYHCDHDNRHSKDKEEILRQLGFNGCHKCGYWGNNFASIDFHHKNGENKKFMICNVISRHMRVSIADLFNEIEKCDILCRNCHRLQHFDVDYFDKCKNKIIQKSKSYKEIQKKINRDVIIDMYENKKMRQCDIRKELGCAKSTISMVIKNHLGR